MCVTVPGRLSFGREVTGPSAAVQPRQEPWDELEAVPAAPGQGLSTEGGTFSAGTCSLGGGSVMRGSLWGHGPWNPNSDAAGAPRPCGAQFPVPGVR